jgi:hypothetical protein
MKTEENKLKIFERKILRKIYRRSVEMATGIADTVMNYTNYGKVVK